MHTIALRLIATLAVCGVALLFTGCGSNNTGKIEGKWEEVSNSELGQELNEVRAQGLKIIYHFKPDGTLKVAVKEADDSLRATLAAIKANLATLELDTEGKYTLLSGDMVQFTGAKNALGTKELICYITIVDDTMTLKKPDGNIVTFTRLK